MGFSRTLTSTARTEPFSISPDVGSPSLRSNAPSFYLSLDVAMNVVYSFHSLLHFASPLLSEENPSDFIRTINSVC